MDRASFSDTPSLQIPLLYPDAREFPMTIPLTSGILEDRGWVNEKREDFLLSCFDDILRQMGMAWYTPLKITYPLVRIHELRFSLRVYPILNYTLKSVLLEQLGRRWIRRTGWAERVR